MMIGNNDDDNTAEPQIRDLILDERSYTSLSDQIFWNLSWTHVHIIPSVGFILCSISISIYKLYKGAFFFSSSILSSSILMLDRSLPMKSRKGWLMTHLPLFATHSYLVCDITDTVCWHKIAFTDSSWYIYIYIYTLTYIHVYPWYMCSYQLMM